MLTIEIEKQVNNMRNELNELLSNVETAIEYDSSTDELLLLLKEYKQKIDEYMEFINNLN